MSGYYAELAAELRRIADDLEPLDERGVAPLSSVSLNFQPGPFRPEQETTATVDAIGLALLGQPGAPMEMSGGSYHHDARGRRGSISVGAFTSVSSPQERERQAELERLRAEVERLRGQAGEAS